MKILILAKSDYSGAGYALLQAVRQFTQHEIRAAAMFQSWVRYSSDIVDPEKKELKKLIMWCDVLNIHDHGGAFLPPTAPLRPIVHTFHGTWYRDRRKKVNRRCLRGKHLQTCLTIELTRFGPRWIGRPQVSLALYHPHPTGRPLQVMQAPTRPDRKGTEILQEALENMPGVELTIITKVTHEQCIRAKAKADVLVDQVGPVALGYGTNAVEAWAYNIPVISWGPPDVEERMNALIGYVPYISALTPQDVRLAVKRLRDERRYYKQWQLAGRRCWSLFHSPQIVARQFIAACEEVLQR